MKLQSSPFRAAVQRRAQKPTVKWLLPIAAVLLAWIVSHGCHGDGDHELMVVPIHNSRE